MATLARVSVAEFLAAGRAALASALASVSSVSSPVASSPTSSVASCVESSAASSEVSSSALPSRPLAIVVGNEAADLDSLCSAILLAYFRTYCVRPSRLYIPVANVNRLDFSLRREFAYVLDLVDSDLRPADMPSLDDVIALPAAATTDSLWLLVDHNALTGPLRGRFGDQIVGCIDHHADEGMLRPLSNFPLPHQRWPDVRVEMSTEQSLESRPTSERGLAAGHYNGQFGAGIPSKPGPGEHLPMPLTEPCIIMEAGSCASLVTQYCRPGWDTLPQDPVDIGLARLGLGPILQDTFCMTEKVTDHDRGAIAYLEAKIKGQHLTRLVMVDGIETETDVRRYAPAYDRAGFHERIRHISHDLDSLSIRDILRRDYKEWSNVGSVAWGISVVPAGFGYLRRRTDGLRGTLAAMQAFAASRHLDMLVVMTVTVEKHFDELKSRGVIERYFFVGGWTPLGAVAAQQVGELCQESLDLRQGLYAAGLDGEESGMSYHKCWQQRNVSKGRKQIAPMLRQILAG